MNGGLEGKEEKEFVTSIPLMEGGEGLDSISLVQSYTNCMHGAIKVDCG